MLSTSNIKAFSRFANFWSSVSKITVVQPATNDDDFNEAMKLIKAAVMANS